MGPWFHVETLAPGGTVRLRLAGELDVLCCEALGAAFDGAQREASGSLILLDFNEVELLSVAAARVLIDAQRRYRVDGGRVVVQHLPAGVDRVLRISGLDRAFEILDSMPGVVRRSAPPGAEVVQIEGTVSPATVIELEHRLGETPPTDGQRLVVDFSRATVPAGRVTITLCSALRRLGRPEHPLVVVGAPPAVELILGLCADGVELPDRRA